MSERRYRDGETIFRRGDSADGVFRIVSGAVGLSAPDGAETVLARGQVFGVAGVLGEGVRDVDAVAHGAATIEFLHARDVLALLSPRDDLLSGAVATLFAELDAAAAVAVAAGPPPEEPLSEDAEAGAEVEDARAAAGDEDPGALGADPPGPPPVRIRLIPDGKRIRELLGADAIEIERLPFRIGRKAGDEPSSAYRDIDLALQDKRPFSLSRRHLSIETRNGELVVRDCGSYHGSVVGGMDLSSDWRARIVPLETGETAIVAGGPDSPFRFRVVVG